MSKKTRIVLVQYPIRSDFAANKKKVFELLKQAASSHPDTIILPEMWLGAPRQKRDRDPWALSYRKMLGEVREWAQKNRCSLFFTQIEKSGGRFFNTAYFVRANGRIGGHYRKIHLFSLGGERRLYSAGSRLGIFSTTAGKVGVVICYDIRFPELVRSLAVAGIKLLIVPAQWPKVRDQHWETLLQAGAIENQIFVIGVNSKGRKEGLMFSGNSLVFDPWGRHIIRMSSVQSLGLCDLDLKEVGSIRKKYPFFAKKKLA